VSALSEWVDADRAHVHRLTERHLAVLTGIARGGSNAEIAAALFMGTSTAHRLRVELFALLKVGNAAHAVAVAYDYGILQPPDWRCRMSRVWPATGPLVEPPVRSGVHSRPGETWRQCSCDATTGQACDVCTGAEADAYEQRRAHRPPHGRPLTDAEVMRIVEACRPTNDETERNGAA